MNEDLKVALTIVTTIVVFLLLLPWIGMGVGEYFRWVWS